MVGNERLIRIILQKGADINSPPSIYHGRTAVQAAANHPDKRGLNLLLEEGADINGPRALLYGATALQIAIAARNVEGVETLLYKGAVINNAIHLMGSNVWNWLSALTTKQSETRLFIFCCELGHLLGQPSRANIAMLHFKLQ